MGSWETAVFPMDIFRRLPPELIYQIIFYLTDFPDVEAIVTASPSANAVLQARPKLAQDLLRANSITGTREIERLCYHTALIDARLIHCADFRHYQFSCSSMPIGSYPEALSIIKLAARIQRLACVCLAISRENFVTAVGKAYGTQRGHCKRAQMAGEPFSWMEEYRVYWSLWRLQHYSLLRGAATGRWGWDKMSLMDLDAYLVWTSIDERLAERIWTVAALLSDLGLETVYGHYSLQHKPKSFSQYPYSKRDFLAQESEGQESFRAAWTFPRETPIPFIARLDLLSHARHGRTIATLLPSWTPPPVPDKNEATVAWRLLPEYSSSEQEHLEDIRRFARVDSSLVRPSYTMADMKPWRRLGIALWDSWRMTTAGLFQCLSPGRVPVTDIGSIPDLRGRLEIDTSLALMVGRFFPTA